MAMRRTGSTAKGAKGMSLLWETDTLTPGARGLNSFVQKAIGTTLAYHEPQAENYAKQNAPWTDQTTNARNGLIARSGKTANEYWLVVAHQVPYGIYLETRWSGKYAIIGPTLEEFGPKIMNTLEGILDRYSALHGGV